MLHHVVLFSAKKPEDVETIFQGLKILEGIPHSEKLVVTKNIKRDQISAEIDVVVFGLFKDEAQLADYKAHPLYQESIDRVRPLRETRARGGFLHRGVKHASISDLFASQWMCALCSHYLNCC